MALHRLTGVDFSIDDLIGLRFLSRRIDLGGKSITRSSNAGGYYSRFRGRGMDFDETRRYSAGDDIRTMDWRVTARTGQPHTKMFREERERPVLVVVDFNPSMYFGSRVAFKSVVAAECAALICWSAIANADRVGALVYSARSHREARPASGKRGVLHVLKTLVDEHKAGNAANGDAVALSQSLLNLRHVVRPGSLIFIFSDFYHLGEDAEQHLSRLRQHNDIVMCSIVDPLEAQPPPPGRYAVTNGIQRMMLDTASKIVRQNYIADFQRRRNDLQQLARGRNIPLITIATDVDPVSSLRGGLFNESQAVQTEKTTSSKLGGTDV